MFEIFSLRLAAGLVAALGALPRGVVEPRFYRIHLMISLCLFGAAGAFAAAVQNDWFWLALGAAGGAALLAVWSWSIAELGALRLPTAVVAVIGGLAALAAAASPRSLGSAWVMDRCADVTAALLLGAVTTAMLLGHWYLIAPNLTTLPLLRLHKLIFAALASRAACVALSLAVATGGTYAIDRLGWLWLVVRVGSGLLGAAVLVKMSFEAAKIRSTQSATGILYVAVIFVFIGELTDQLLMDHMGSPGV
jgi:hypothetical protein